VTKQKDEIAMLKKELKLQRKTIAVYEDRLSKVLAHEVGNKLRQAPPSPAKLPTCCCSCLCLPWACILCSRLPHSLVGAWQRCCCGRSCI
jgi:hypothetical protein